jgi:hypothetical protein
VPDEKSYAELSPELSGPRYEYAQFFFQTPTTVHFSHRESGWENLSAIDALQSLGEYGFELVSVVNSVLAYQGEQHPLSNLDMGVPTGRRSQYLEATQMTSLYVFKRLVGQDEPLDLQVISPETHSRHLHHFNAWLLFHREFKESPGVGWVQRVRMFRQKYQPLDRHPYRETPG